MTEHYPDLRPHCDESFRDAVLSGLSRRQKTIPSAWLYDARGSDLFNAITELKAYYPTRTETGILRDRAAEIALFLGEGAVLLEYGAGAGIKTEILLGALESPTLYAPIDIAGDELERTARRIDEKFPGLKVLPILADFTADFDLPNLPRGTRAGFFPGSTIGNLDRRQTGAFLARMRRHVRGGAAVIGIDLKKDVATLLRAYDDEEGVTAAFNLNLLARINRELDADFPLPRFAHQARWNEEESAVEMHLVSLDARKVRVAGASFALEAGESIHTESSRKYDLAGFGAQAAAEGWRMTKVWRDPLGLFALVGLDAVA